MSDANKPVSWRDLPDNSAPIPRTVATVWVKEVHTNPSKSGQPMVKLDMEILAPASATVAGKPIGLAGREFSSWIVFNPSSRRGFENADTLVKLAVEGGLPNEVMPSDIPELIKHVVKGKVLVGLTIDNEAQYETEADGKTVKKDEQGNAIVKRNNIVVKAWVPAVTPESQGIQIGG